jgi:hypothetical protein
MLSFDRKTRLLVDLTLSAAAKGTAGPDSSADACIASHGVEPANERRGTRRVQDETEDNIMPAAASNDADTRRGAASRSGLQPQAKRKKTNDSRGKAFRVEHLRTFGLKVTQRESTTGKIASVACRFCFNFGREPRAGASEAAAAGKKSKYKTKTIVKQFSQPWRTDAVTQHLGAQGEVVGVR